MTLDINSNGNKVVFYHVYLFDDKYKLWINEQLGLIEKSKLYTQAKININIAYHCEEMLTACIQYINSVFPWVDNITSSKESKARRSLGKKKEGVTLKLIHDHAKNNPHDKILYIHTKGSSRPFKDINKFPSNDMKPWVYSWRNAMNDQMINKHQQCLADLEKYDVVGIKWKHKPVPHFSGNFWWVNAKWIAKLEDPVNEIRYWRWGRFSCEYWVCGNYATPDSRDQKPRDCIPKTVDCKCKKYKYTIKRRS
jgi:uncharacterized protein involved in tolerance to divalent cations